MNIKRLLLKRISFLIVCSLFVNIILSSSVFAEGNAEVEAAQEAPVESEEASSENESSSSGIPSDQATIDAGASIFNANCKSCHAIDKKVVGPALMGVTERRELGWIISWIKNPAGMVESGDETAVQLFEEYKTMMTGFGSLSDQEIVSVLAYVENWEPPVEEKAVESTSGGETAQSGASDEILVLVLTIVLVVLILIVGVLILLSLLLRKELKAKEDLTEDEERFINEKHSVLPLITNPIFIGVVAVFAVVVGLVLGVEKGLYSVGVQQGYMPAQPIPYSHKLHAGELGIDCNYCHTGVRKSKHANIPSPNICMNCHAYVKTESPYIKRIHAAIDYDAESQTYGKTGKTHPIEWVRIHNLPDLVYFNHSQHVKVGGIECQTCHGPIEEMEVVYQYSPLTMGWCIDCHKKTAVKSKDNNYYDKLVKFHEETKGSKEPMTVEDIGGLECSKCHY